MKYFLLFLFLIFFQTSLFAKDIYIKVMSVHDNNLFSAVYNLDELGFTAITEKYNQWNRIYVGPFHNSNNAEKSLRLIKNNIAKDAFLVQKSRTSEKKIKSNKKSYESIKNKKNRLYSIEDNIRLGSVTDYKDDTNFGNGLEEKDEQKYKVSHNDIKLLIKDNIRIGLIAYNYNKEDTSLGNVLEKRDGRKYGVSLNAIKLLNDTYYIKGSIVYSQGDSNYYASYDSYTGNVPENVYEINTNLGMQMSISNSLFSPYIGLGYRELFSDGREVNSFRYKNNFLYLPIGLVYAFSIADTSSVVTTVEYDYFLNGEFKSYLSDVDSINVTHKQKEGKGLKLNIAYEELDWSIGLFYNKWDIGISEWVNGVKIPNMTKEVGVHLQYHF